MRVVTIYCRVTRVTAHTFVPSTNKHKQQHEHLDGALGFTKCCLETKELLEFVTISEHLYCLRYKIAFVYFPAFSLN